MGETICQLCGDIGAQNALVFCVKCLDFAIHRYCLPVIPETRDEFVRWFCVNCEEKYGKPSPEKEPFSVYSKKMGLRASKKFPSLRTKPMQMKHIKSTDGSSQHKLIQNVPKEKGNSGLVKPTINLLPVPTIHLPPAPTIHLPPTPSINLTPAPAIHLPTAPAIHLPPAPTINLPPAPTINLPNGKLHIRVVQADNRFPAFLSSASKHITKAFRKKQDKAGTSWKTLPKDVKDGYWNLFKKLCTWDPRAEGVVHAAWERIAAKLYSDWFSRLKKGNKCPEGCNPEVWDAWTVYWNDATVVAKAAIMSANRRGRNGAPSNHTGGSRSHLEHCLSIFKKEGVMPSLLRLFRKLHQRVDGSFCDEKSKYINDKLEERSTKLKGEAKEQGLSVDTIDENKLFLEVMAELRCTEKGRVYGIGNRVSSMSTDGSFSITAKSAIQPPMCQEDTIELIRNLVKETLKEDGFQQKIEQAIQLSMPVIFKPVASHMESKNAHPSQGANASKKKVSQLNIGTNRRTYQGFGDNEFVNVLTGVGLKNMIY